MKPNLVLTGFSGTGKSTVGREVARSLGWTFTDTDDAIVARAGVPIHQLFARDGEARFRRMERDEVARALEGEGRVVSVGGGAVMDDESFALMRGRAVVVCLDAGPDAVLQRLQGARGGSSSPEVRPMLAGADPLERIRSLKAQRAARYAEADWTVHTDGLTLHQVVAEVLRGWRAVRQGVSAPDAYPQPDDLVTVCHTSSGSYPIYAGWGLTQRLPHILRGLGLAETAYLFTDERVLRPHGRRAQLALHEDGFVVHAFIIQPGEPSKSLETAQHAYRWLADARAERGHTVLALGGGVVGDLAGFVAATFLRGMPFVQLPTSLAAMVDASIGGKVAVNLPQAKNLVGAFYQPRAVVADVALLASLPPRELASGWAEAIKHALILDPDLFDLFERQSEPLLALDRDVTTQVVRRSMAIKAGVVVEDERETTGRRSILNYGHTVGHGIEAATEYGDYLHGEAVAVGMHAAALIGQRMGVTPPEVVSRQRQVLERFRLPVAAPYVDPDAVLRAMALDKKTAGGAIRWVLLEDIGRTVLRRDVPLDLAREVVAELCRPEA